MTTIATTSAGRPNPAPFTGLRVLELGTLPAGAYCARLFADFGASVLKLEPPGGDPARASSPRIDSASPGLGSAWFAWLNVGKASAVVDDGAHGADGELARLLGQADVLVDSLTPAQRAELGLDHAALQRARPAKPAPGWSSPISAGSVAKAPGRALPAPMRCVARSAATCS
jgi:crotonobetainyl-CoA:carnitine CoA-transferase CaiB-like acyl-CoA transferase